MSVAEILPQDALLLLQQRSPLVIDVRDALSFRESHLPGAIQLTNDTVEEFLDEADRNRPVIVYCFHGISSRGAAAWLAEKGFVEVLSLAGGFEGWRWNFPVESGS